MNYTEKDIYNIEHELNIKLPLDFKDYLIHNNKSPLHITIEPQLLKEKCIVPDGDVNYVFDDYDGICSDDECDNCFKIHNFLSGFVQLDISHFIMINGWLSGSIWFHDDVEDKITLVYNSFDNYLESLASNLD